MIHVKGRRLVFLGVSQCGSLEVLVQVEAVLPVGVGRNSEIL